MSFNEITPKANAEKLQGACMVEGQAESPAEPGRGTGRQSLGLVAIGAAVALLVIASIVAPTPQGPSTAAAQDGSGIGASGETDCERICNRILSTNN